MSKESRPAGTLNVYVVGICTVVVGIALIVTGLRDLNLERRVRELEQKVEYITTPRPAPGAPKTGRVDVKQPGDQPS